MQSISNLFGSLAYLIGALISNYTLIYVGVGLVLVFSIIPLFFIEEPKELAKNDEDSDGTEKGGSTNWIELYKIYIAHGFSWIGIQTMFVYIIAFLMQKMFTPDTVEKIEIIQQIKVNNGTLSEELSNIDQMVSSETGMMIGISFFLLNGIGAFLPIFLIEPLTKIWGQVRTHYLAVAAMAVGYFGIVFFAEDKYTLFAMMAVVSIGWSAVVSLPFAIMTENVDKSRMGFFMGIFNLSVVIPQLIVSLVIGYFINEAADKNIVFIISGVSLAISAILWTIVKEPVKEASIKEVKA